MTRYDIPSLIKCFLSADVGGNSFNSSIRASPILLMPIFDVATTEIHAINDKIIIFPL